MAKHDSRVRKRSSRAASVLPPVPLCLGTDTIRTILDRRQQPMSLEELHLALDRVVRAWLAAACIWNHGWSMGDQRYVVFSIEVAPETQVYVQLWSEPLEPVVWEVSSGRGGTPADKWLAGERSDRIASSDSRWPVATRISHGNCPSSRGLS